MKSCYRLAICALLLFCTTGKSFTENDYVSFISEAFETSGMGIEACLAKISHHPDYKVRIFEGDFCFDEKVFPLNDDMRVAEKTNLLFLIADFEDCTPFPLKRYYGILNFRALNTSLREYYSTTWENLQKIALESVSKVYNTEINGVSLEQPLLSLAKTNAELPYIPEEITKSELESIGKKFAKTISNKSSGSDSGSGSSIEVSAGTSTPLQKIHR